MCNRIRKWPWLTIQIIGANVAIVITLAIAWYLVFSYQSSVYSDRLMSTFNIEPGSLHAMYVDDVERQLWISVVLGLIAAILASVGLALLIVRPLRSLANGTERLRHGDYGVRSDLKTGEVGRLAGNFNALASELEMEESRRAQFMADLGHELRTPITSIRGYTEGLEDGVFNADKQYFRLMSDELNHLTALTHTIETMQLQGDDEHVASPQQVQISDFLERARDHWEARFDQNDLRLVLQIPEELSDADIAIAQTSFKQIIDNLLSNMLRYASPEEACRIDVSARRRKHEIALACSNAAPEIDDDALPRLFDRFYRGSESRNRTHPVNEHPSGLGLSVVKQLCIANQGKVTASMNGGRLTITIILPTSEQQLH